VENDIFRHSQEWVYYCRTLSDLLSDVVFCRTKSENVVKCLQCLFLSENVYFRQKVSKTNLNAKRLLSINKVNEYVYNNFLAKTIAILYEKNSVARPSVPKRLANFAQDVF